MLSSSYGCTAGKADTSLKEWAMSWGGGQEEEDEEGEAWGKMREK